MPDSEFKGLNDFLSYLVMETYRNLHCIEDHSKAGNPRQVKRESKAPKILSSEANIVRVTQ